MKRIVCILVAICLFSITSYAGNWKHDERGYQYQNDDGSYKTGWYQDIDGKWYYLDDQSGYMLINTITPDGYTVSENGEWVEGVERTIENSTNSYDNKIDINASAYFSGPNLIEPFESTIPVTIYYNNEYMGDSGRTIQVTNVNVSKDGVIYAEYRVSETTYAYDLSITTRYFNDDGTYKDSIHYLGAFWSTIDTVPLMESPSDDTQYSYAEVYIDKGKME